jgi:GTP-binding protein
MSHFTISAVIGVNTSPFAYTEGKKSTSRVIRERLHSEAQLNLDTMKVDDMDSSDNFEIYFGSEEQLFLLLHNMRQEDFEFTVSQPAIVYRRDRDDPSKLLEPYEEIKINVYRDFVNDVTEEFNGRSCKLIEITESADETVNIVFHAATRLLWGFTQQNLTTITQGFGTMTRSFLKYQEVDESNLKNEANRNGVLVSIETGEVKAYGLLKMQDRGIAFIKPHDRIYTGMIIGENTKREDLNLNVLLAKSLSIMRASGSSDEAYNLLPPKIMTLEEMIKYIKNDECIEVTPVSLRMRKRILDSDRRKSDTTIKTYSFKILEDYS